MMLALVNGDRRTAQPKHRGHCPMCAGEVIAKCGPVNAWHWAHKAADCDTWAEPFTGWHAGWQEHFPPDWREITIGNHRADVQTPAGLVIEFQHSALSADEIRERENHYGRMLWVFDAINAWEQDRLLLHRKRKPGIHWRDANAWDEAAFEPDKGYRTFRWKHPRRSILACRRPVFLDLGDGWSRADRRIGQDFGRLLELKRLHPNAPYGGWGYLRTTDEFLDAAQEAWDRGCNPGGEAGIESLHNVRKFPQRLMNRLLTDPGEIDKASAFIKASGPH